MDCYISNQIADHCNRDNDCITCECCGEILEEIYDGKRRALYCGYCECEIEEEDDIDDEFI